MKWVLVLMLVCATTVGDVFRSLGMRQHGEIHDFRPGAIGSAFARGGPQLLRDHFDLRDGGIVLLLHEAGLDRADELRGADVGSHFHSRDSAGEGVPERGSRLAALGGRRVDPGRRGFHLAVIVAW